MEEAAFNEHLDACMCQACVGETVNEKAPIFRALNSGCVVWEGRESGLHF